MGYRDIARRGAFGHLLKRFRERVRHSLKRFGKKVGRSHTFVSRVESGTRKPPPEDLDRWAEALGLNQTDRAAFRAEAALAHVPDALREELRTFLRAEGVRRYRDRRRKPARWEDDVVLDEDNFWADEPPA